MRKAVALLFASFALHSLLVVWAAPSVSIGPIKFGVDKTFDKNYENVKSKIYNIITTVSTKKDKCTKRVTVTGNGIGDVFDLACTENGVVTTTTEKLLIYGNPKEDSFFLFSDEPSNLIVFQNGKCTKKTYTTNNKKTSGVMTELKDEDCKAVESKINYIQDAENKYLKSLNSNGDGNDDQSETPVSSATTDGSKDIPISGLSSSGTDIPISGLSSSGTDIPISGLSSSSSSTSYLSSSFPTYYSGNGFNWKS